MEEKDNRQICFLCITLTALWELKEASKMRKKEQLVLQKFRLEIKLLC